MNTNSRDTDCEISLRIPPELEGMRVDRALAALLPEYSRSTIQGWIRTGRVLAGGRPLKASERLSGAGPVAVSIPPPEPSEWLAEPMALDVLHEDSHLFVIDKPAGLVVHPGAGNPDGTLLNGLLARDEGLRLLPRAGIVHRLDKDTSGLMVVARTESSRQDLVKQLSNRSVSRHYLAVAAGVPVSGETLDRPIGRHPVDRRRMAVSDRGKPAVTHVSILEKYRAHALMEARLETAGPIRSGYTWRGGATPWWGTRSMAAGHVLRRARPQSLPASWRDSGARHCTPPSCPCRIRKPVNPCPGASLLRKISKTWSMPSSGITGRSSQHDFHCASPGRGTGGCRDCLPHRLLNSPSVNGAFRCPSPEFVVKLIR